jgi:hypothetical protein
LGHELIEWADAYIRARGREWFRLDVVTSNGPLRRYYEAVGSGIAETWKVSSCSPTAPSVRGTPACTSDGAGAHRMPDERHPGVERARR